MSLKGILLLYVPRAFVELGRLFEFLNVLGLRLLGRGSSR
jgi:hypothetical protein